MPDLSDLSIVVCSKNDYAGLTRTLNSLDGKDLAKSTKIVVLSDYSRFHIEKFTTEFAHKSFHIYEIEPKGIYFAQNFGLSKVETNFVQFLNGGDELIEPVGLTELMNKLETAEWGYGSLIVISQSGNSRKYRFRYQMLLHRLALRYVPHPSTVLRTKVAMDLGGYDENYPSAADHKLLIKFGQRGKPVITKKALAKFYLGGLSSRSQELIVADCSKVSREVFGFFFGSQKIDTIVWKMILAIRTIKN